MKKQGKQKGNWFVTEMNNLKQTRSIPTIYLAIKQHYLHICPRPVKIWNDKLWYIACREVPTKTRLEKPKEFETCICLRCIWGRHGPVICTHQLGHVATSNLFYAVDPWCCGHGGTKKSGKKVMFNATDLDNFIWTRVVSLQSFFSVMLQIIFSQDKNIQILFIFKNGGNEAAKASNIKD